MQIKQIYMYPDILEFDIYIGCMKIYLTYSMTIWNLSYKGTHVM